MKRSVLMMMGTFLLTGAAASWAADDGAALYKSKCAGCHGANGEGKPAMKAPALERDVSVRRPDHGASGKGYAHQRGPA